MNKRLHNFLLIFAAFFLTSCEVDQKKSVITKRCPDCVCNTQKVDYNFCGEVTLICLNEIVYYYNDCGIAARLNSDGTAVKCPKHQSIRPEWNENFKDLYD